MGDDLDDLLGAYALDAIDDDERRWIEARLASDVAARAELARLRRVASLLAFTRGKVKPPEPGAG